jgi:hypothetical protein
MPRARQTDATWPRASFSFEGTAALPASVIEYRGSRRPLAGSRDLPSSQPAVTHAVQGIARGPVGHARQPGELGRVAGPRGRPQEDREELRDGHRAPPSWLRRFPADPAVLVTVEGRGRLPCPAVHGH